MSGFQAPSAFNFGLPPTGYSAPMLPTDAYSLMSGYGSTGGNTGELAFNPSSIAKWGVGGSTPAAGGGWNWFDSTDPITGVKSQGAATPMLGAAQGLLSAFMGMKQYGLAKDSLAEGKRQFGLNFEAQKTTTNSQLEDRQRARVASNAGAYQSVGDYMSQNAIKG